MEVIKVMWTGVISNDFDNVYKDIQKLTSPGTLLMHSFIPADDVWFILISSNQWNESLHVVIFWWFKCSTYATSIVQSCTCLSYVNASTLPQLKLKLKKLQRWFCVKKEGKKIQII